MPGSCLLRARFCDIRDAVTPYISVRLCEGLPGTLGGTSLSLGVVRRTALSLGVMRRTALSLGVVRRTALSLGVFRRVALSLGPKVQLCNCVSAFIGPWCLDSEPMQAPDIEPMQARHASIGEHASSFLFSMDLFSDSHLDVMDVSGEKGSPCAQTGPISPHAVSGRAWIGALAIIQLRPLTLRGWISRCTTPRLHMVLGTNPTMHPSY